MIKLYDLLDSIDVIKSWNMKNITINKIAYHSKKVVPDDVFVCIKGYKTDGHKYISNALESGAGAIIVEDFQPDLSIPQIQVKDTRKALAALSSAFYGNPSKSMKTIGITATNGKTTTSFMLNSIFEKHNLKTGLIGTVMVKAGDFYEPSILTTPESLDLQAYFSKMRDKNVSHVTMEVSSSALDLKRVANVDFDIVSFNNVSREHIDLHGSFDKYFDSKASLIRNAGADKWAVLNIDDPLIKQLVNETKANVVTFGVNSDDGHIACRNLDLSTGRAKYTIEILKSFKVGNITYNPTSFDIKLSVPGYHSVSNSIVSIIIALICGIPIPTIQESLRTFVGVERRFEFIYEDDFIIVDDHFANTANINATFETIKYMDYNKLTIVYSIRGSRGPTVNRENAEAIVSWASKLGIKEIIASLSKSHVGEKDIVTKEELDVFKNVMKNAGIKIHLFDELSDAISLAINNVKPRDIILLSGCQGMDYGAQIALKQLYKLRPYLNEDQLFKSIEKRVAGIL
ncbi:Mur ligase family protein [Abyssisolibacter fermentans]|uniref:Mur ligase family protein n=1 Tax=Abyssisolibacter fermentans TaxID=1766203 RepID=UPI000836837E|nr:UDP-N-acetylmuramyl-tripeptide synthetase [Abyssisolibacter fermentans]